MLFNSKGLKEWTVKKFTCYCEPQTLEFMKRVILVIIHPNVCVYVVGRGIILSPHSICPQMITCYLNQSVFPCFAYKYLEIATCHYKKSLPLVKGDSPFL